MRAWFANEHNSISHMNESWVRDNKREGWGGGGRMMGAEFSSSYARTPMHLPPQSKSIFEIVSFATAPRSSSMT